MSEELNESILEALEGDDPNVLRSACMMAGLMKIKQAERSLLKALNHKAWQVQAEAARALGRLEAAGAAPYLRRLLKASEAELRQKMLTSAAGVAGAAPGEDAGEEGHPEVRKQAAIALNRLNPEITQEALMAALRSDQANLLSAAMAGLANLEALEGRERMLELLMSGDANLRRTAAASLGKLRERRAVPRLVELLNDSDASVRKEAIIALNHIKDKSAIEPLCQTTADGDKEVRRVAAIALGNTRSKDEAVVKALVGCLRDRDAAVRKAALSALGNLKATSTLEDVAGLLKDTHDEVCRQAGVTVALLAGLRERPDYEAS